MDQVIDAGLRDQLESMITRSKTKLIAPLLTAGILREHAASGKVDFSESAMRAAYEAEVCHAVRHVLGHSLHIGGQYEDAYSSRTLPKYGVVSPKPGRTYALVPRYAERAEECLRYIAARLPVFVEAKLGGVIGLQSAERRLAASATVPAFLSVLDEEIRRSAAHFEIVSFAVLRTHLEKFACRLYRSSRTSARDRGIDIATDFGAVYQIKDMHLRTIQDVQEVYSELLTNFDLGRLQDGKVVLVIDDLSVACRQFLIEMRVRPVARDDIMRLASLLSEPEDRQKVLRVIYEEFEREYRSDICMSCRVTPRIPGCSFIPGDGSPPAFAVGAQDEDAAVAATAEGCSSRSPHAHRE